MGQRLRSDKCTFIAHRPRPRYGDDGQVSIIVVLAVGTFLMMFVGFGVDMTNLFFHRQMAQNAADAACVAAGMDMQKERVDGPSGCTVGTTPKTYACGNFPAALGTSFDCTGHSDPTDAKNGAAPCQYAWVNGYQSPGLTAGTESNLVSVSFPASVPGAITPNLEISGPVPFVQVDVVDRVRVYFTSWIGGSSTQDVHALAKCGLQSAQVPVPIIVLDPICQHSFEVSGSASISITGGPIKSIQVNSNNSTCAAATTSGQGQCDGNAIIDLSKGGPALTGSQFGVTGQPNTASTPGAPTNFKPGTTGAWVSPSAPINDPWASLVAPTRPAQVDGATTGNFGGTTIHYGAIPPDPLVANGGPCQTVTNPCQVAYDPSNALTGCPDPSGCLEYGRGWYANSIVVKNFTAIFDPGLYYLTGADDSENCGSPGTGCLNVKGGGGCNYGFSVGSNGVVRPSAAVGDGSGGTMFYLSSTSGKAGTWPSVFFGSNAGSNAKVANFPSASVNCPGFSCPPKIVCPALPPSGFAGNILMGPCTGPYSVQDDATPPNNYHGMLFWDDRANGDPNGQPSMQGGGGLALVGNLYFHNCVGNPKSCDPAPTSYNAFLNLQGTPGSATYVFGDITTDELIEGGNGSINMVLNTNLVTNILKVALLQ
jgi:putative Flp pilus-assembly TadE/G-like protein